eukprot:6180286-Pleurochrysis_carterae.AAC.1
MLLELQYCSQLMLGDDLSRRCGMAAQLSRSKVKATFDDQTMCILEPKCDIHNVHFSSYLQNLERQVQSWISESSIALNKQ